MPKDEGKKALDGLLKTYLSLGDDAKTIVRHLKGMSSAVARGRLIQELRSLDRKRLEILDQMDNLGKSL